MKNNTSGSSAGFLGNGFRVPFRDFLRRLQHASTWPQSREELIEVVRQAERNDVLSGGTLRVIQGALEVSTTQVREIMVPRPNMVVIRSSENLDEFLPRVIESAHSRFPVVGENLDEVLGVLLAKDLIRLLNEGARDNFVLTKLLHPISAVPESKRANVLLEEFRNGRQHMAVVVDEYGGTSGLVTIEDVLEEIVGEIEDEKDQEGVADILKLSEDNYLVRALIPVEDFNAHFNASLDPRSFDTLGGILLHHFGRLPKPGESALIDGLRITVAAADNRRVEQVRVKARPTA